MWERTSEKVAENQAVSCPSGETEECFTAYPVQHTDSTGQIAEFPRSAKLLDGAP